MTFAEKLDILINLTNTSNSVLARNISIDASFISRLRRGVRTPAKNANYIPAMVEYFTRNFRAEYQISALFDAIKSSSKIYPQATDSLAELINEWLREENETNPNSIDDFLNDVNHFQFKKVEPMTAVEIDRMECKPLSEAEVFYGIEGKQNAVLMFLSLVLKRKSCQTLLLYSDEDLGWLTENLAFTAKWSALLAQVIKSGNKIKIIHTVKRGFDDMLSAIKEWVPIYMTGAIEPYYYPKTRDGLFRRTLFIAPDTAAVTSCSVGNGTKNAANFLFTNKNTIKALIEEYNDFLSLCRPLMRIYTPFNHKEYLPLLAEFEGEDTNTIVKTDTLTNITMPPYVIESIAARMENTNREQLLTYQQKRIAKFTAGLEKYCFTEIVPLPDLDKVLAGKFAVNFSDILNETQLFYTPEEYGQHLQNIIQLLKTYDNYNVHLSSDKHLEGSMLYVREDVGVLAGKTSLPSVIFAINESYMTSAFWDYMVVLINRGSQIKMHKTHTIAKFEEIVHQLGVII